MILVTGGTGLVGSHLLFDLVKKGVPVRALKRENSSLQDIRDCFAYYSDSADELFDKIEWVNGDMLDPDSLDEALKGISNVFHCAGLVSFKKADKKRMKNINVEGTRNIVDASLNAKIKKFCFISSISALGSSEDPGDTVTETTPWSPEDKRSDYSKSKFNSELEVWRGIEEGLDAVIVNPSIILGPGHWHKGSSLLLTTVAKGVKYFTRGITGYVDVRDVSKAMIQLMDSDIKNDRFLLNSENCSYEFIFKSIARALNLPEPYKYASPRLTEIAWRLAYLKTIFLFKESSFTRSTARSSHNCTYFSSQKIKDTLNFEFISVEDCIKNMAKHYPLNNI
ncbi:NAD-dependent epimerase/dehydratase family protein [Ancylomarina sp. 16SWW S1-10-2]|uniref:NAD-dependent epimerase/dehydratase family protein n=1 Tax=Ancylomarina sp. 16SWW S1-10-2 TaxID=2499681 RepID=UPI0012AE4B5F|nr:NAD-dependent epimerase/dehydratase family protein [Ancylomarina sp. 16SWW S1-10-2]MRT92365.1 NAD-dependent epimerase/dehydratase family protein [Ancylomarina sp. 16SWW S1-10-2]